MKQYSLVTSVIQVEVYKSVIIQHNKDECHQMDPITKQNSKKLNLAIKS